MSKNIRTSFGSAGIVSRLTAQEVNASFETGTRWFWNYICAGREPKKNNRLRAEEFAVRAWNVHIVPAPSDTDQWSQARMLEQHWDAKDLAGIRIGYSSPPTHPAIYIWSHNWTRKVREITLFSAPCTVYCRRDSVSLESEYERNWLRVWEREEWWEHPKMPSRT